MKKIAIYVLLVLFSFQLLACSSKNVKSTGNSKNDKKTVVIACSKTPHAEIMEVVKPIMKEKGFDLIVKEASDYVTPNLAVNSGEIELNFCQHLPYLENFNQENHTSLSSIVAVHYEPFGIYAGNKNTLSFSNGDRIAIPNDISNCARALWLLENAGVLTLKEEAEFPFTMDDIIDNPYNIELIEMEPSQIPSARNSVSFAIINGNYAMESGLTADDALFLEDADSEASMVFANVICVRAGNEGTSYSKALIESLSDKRVKEFIKNKYGKSVIYID